VWLEETEVTQAMAKLKTMRHHGELLKSKAREGAGDVQETMSNYIATLTAIPSM